MISLESLEKRSPDLQAIPEEQREASRIIASVLLLGLEDSSITEGFSPGELMVIKRNITEHHFTGELGESLGEVSPKDLAVLSGKPQK